MIYYKKKSLIKKVCNIFQKRKEEAKFFSASFFKNLLIFLFVLFFGVYFAYLFLAPKYIDEDNIHKIINNYVLKNSKLTFETNNFSFKTDYKFNINLKADNLNLNYPNKKNFISINKLDLDIDIFSLLFGFLDLNKIKADEISINTKFNKDKKYDCFNYFEIKSKNDSAKLKLRNINILANKFHFNLYDENVDKNFKADFSKIKISNDFKRNVLISSNGTISSSNHKISDLNLNLSIKLNPNSKERFIEKLAKMNYNPLKDALKYKFYSNTTIDLKINPLDEKRHITGLIDLKDYNFVLDDVILPKNNLRLKFSGDKVVANSNFNFIKNQSLKINSTISLKNKFVEAYLKSNEINLSDLNRILEAINEIFNLKLKLNEIELSGFLNVDLYLKSNFKTIFSKGKLALQNAKIKHFKTGLILKDINSDIDFQNNNINILNTSAFINNSKFNLVGKIDSKTNLDLKINSTELNIAQVLTLVNELPFLNIINPHLKNYDFKKGTLKINSNIKGNFENPIIETNSSLVDFDVYNKKDDYNFACQKIIFTTNSTNKKENEIKAQIENSTLKIQNQKIIIPKTQLNLLNNEIIIPKTKLLTENIPIYLTSVIKNYKKQPIIEAKVEIDNLNNNDFVALSKNAKFKADLLYKQEKLTVLSAYLFDDISNLAQLSGSISLNKNEPKFENLKFETSDKIKLIILKLGNLKLDLLGFLTLNGDIKKPNLSAKFNLYNLKSDEFNFSSPEALLNVKNSQFYLTLPKAKFNEIDFDLLANFEIQENNLVFNLLKFSSNYINLQNVQKTLSSKASSKPMELNIKSIQANILTLENEDFLFNSLSFDGNLKNNELNINNFGADYLNGKIKASGKINLLDKKLETKINLNGLNIRLLSNKLKENLIAISGKLNADIDLKSNSLFIDDVIFNSKSKINFTIENGELSQFAKLERFLQAGNILSQSILKLSLNSALSALSKQNTGDFKLIEGKINVNQTIADIEYIKTQGSNMSLYIDGEFDFLKQYMIGDIFGRIPVSTVNVLGNFGKFSFNKEVDKISNDDTKEMIKTITASPIEKMLSSEISQSNLDKIPPLAYQNTTNETREFVVNINGNVKNLNSIRDFKWGIKP
ncbi:MAG: hypothetical protein E7Z88_07300 [Cyanobacteria bacterium SIG27]|nr:hypothetical protein [Cyanobacteria bacterium SIG27]